MAIHLRSLLIFLLVSAPASPAVAAPVAGDSGDEPLPPGAIGRLGGGQLRPRGEVLAVAFAPDNRSLWVACATPHIEVWDLVTGRRRRHIEVRLPGGPEVRSPSLSACFTPDARVLVVNARPGLLEVVQAESGDVRAALACTSANGPPRITASADGKRVAARSGWDDLDVWSADEGKLLYTLGPSKNGEDACLTPDGKHLVVLQENGSGRLLDAATGREIRTLETALAATGKRRQSSCPRALPLPPDNIRAFFWSRGERLAVVSLQTGKVVQRIDHPFPPGRPMALSPEGRFLAIEMETGVRLFGLASGQELTWLEAPPAMSSGQPVFPQQLVFSSDGRWLARVDKDGRLVVWDVLAGRRMHSAEGHTQAVEGLVFLNGGKRLVTTAADGRLLVWDTATGRVLRQCQHWMYEDSLRRTTNGRGVECRDEGAYLRAWEIGEDVELPFWSGPSIVPVLATTATSPDGQREAMVSRGRDGRLRLFLADAKSATPRVLAPVEVTTRATSLPMLGAFTAKIYGKLSFSPDGRRLLLNAWQALEVWDRASGRRLLCLQQADSIKEDMVVHWSADGRCLLIGDKVLRLVEISSGQPRHIFPGEMSPYYTRLACSPDGRFIARDDEDGSILVYATDTGGLAAHWHADHGAVCSLAFSPDSQVVASGGFNGSVLLWRLPAPNKGPSTPLTPGQQAELWDRLAGGPEVAAEAMAAWARAPGQAVEWMRQRLRPVVVRLDRKKIEKLVADLDVDAFPVRQQASKELAAAGHAAEDVLRKALGRSPSPEVCRSLERLLARLGPEARIRERLQAVRAVEVLERIASPEARRLLAELEKEISDPVVVEEVRDSLARWKE